MKNNLNLIWLMLLLNCATTMQTTETRSRIINAEFEQVQSAIIEYFNERGFAIASAENGIINTDYKSSGGMTSAMLGEMRSKVNAILTRAGERQTKIVLTLVLEQKSGTAWRSLNVPARQYQTYLDEIEQKALKKNFKKS